MQWKVRLWHVQVQLMFIWGECNVCIECGKHDEYRVDVAKLAAITQGTELLVLENTVHAQKSYRLEDFFWTGSGDGPDEEDTSTVYSTKTVLSTVYVTSTEYINQSTTAPCTVDCEPVTPHGDIDPTPTYPNEVDLDADRQFWLLTVLRNDGKDPDVGELRRSLTNLYRKAFLRQQEEHLGIHPKSKREAKPDKPVNVYIHEIDTKPEEGEEYVRVIYHVAVAGLPVDAATAATDMRLITDDEVKDELGYPFLIKAEPYVKTSTNEGLRDDKPKWVFVSVSVAVVLLLLLGVACLTICMTKRQDSRATENKRQVYNEEGAKDVKSYTVEKQEARYRSGRRNVNPSPTYVNFRNQPSNETLMSGFNLARPQSGMSSGSSSSTSFDISPLMGLGKQRNLAKKPNRPRAAINKTTPLVINKRSSLSVVDTDSSSLANSPDTIFIGNCDPGVVSPKSYLSMPSVKSFPRGNNPEPLNKVLEPVSVLHLDMADDVDNQRTKDFPRHGSFDTEEDPGVLGPVVWNLHRQRLQHGVSVDEGMDEMKMSSNVSKMRKRFHDLLDDTFSLFGSRRESPVKEAPPTTPIEVKSHSSADRPCDLPPTKVRPKTSDPKREGASCGGQPPKGAWTSAAPSPLTRPLSAPFVRPNTAPRVDVAQVLADGRLAPDDPAVPLIAAIKKEIGKCSLPGSTTNIHE